MVDTCALEAHAERCSGSSPDEGTDGDFRFLIFNIYLMICKECKKEFSLPKNIINGKIKRNGMGPQFCSKECWADFRREEVELNCAECLNLAFELNGIFHYEPIYGEGKLSQVKNNDGRKFQDCLERKIELCIIDVSSSKHFKPERDKKYLDIIVNLIELKCRGLVEKNQLS